MNRVIVIALASVTIAAAGCASQQQSTTGGQHVAIRVTEKGFEPQVVAVKAGQPVTLEVTRTVEKTCAKELVMKEQGINKPLPLNQTVEIAFTPSKSGDLTYACGMDMYRGTVRVQ